MRCRLDERVSQLLQHTDEGRGNFKKEVKPIFTKDVTYKGIFFKITNWFTTGYPRFATIRKQ